MSMRPEKHFGDSYIGNFVGQRNGHGAYFFADGDIFVGTAKAAPIILPMVLFEHGIWRNGNLMRCCELRKRDCPKSPFHLIIALASLNSMAAINMWASSRTMIFMVLALTSFPMAMCSAAISRKVNGLGLYMFGSTGTAVVMSSWAFCSINGEGVYLFNSDGNGPVTFSPAITRDGLAEAPISILTAQKFIGLAISGTARASPLSRWHQQGRHLERR